MWAGATAAESIHDPRLAIIFASISLGVAFTSLVWQIIEAVWLDAPGVIVYRGEPLPASAS